jgi:hypothetical protein
VSPAEGRDKDGEQRESLNGQHDNDCDASPDDNAKAVATKTVQSPRRTASESKGSRPEGSLDESSAIPELVPEKSHSASVDTSTTTTAENTGTDSIRHAATLAVPTTHDTPEATSPNNGVIREEEAVMLSPGASKIAQRRINPLIARR